MTQHIHSSANGYVQEKMPPRRSARLPSLHKMTPSLQKGEWYWVRFSYTESSRPACFDHEIDGRLYFKYSPIPVPRCDVGERIQRPDDFEVSREWGHPST